MEQTGSKGGASQVAGWSGRDFLGDKTCTTGETQARREEVFALHPAPTVSPFYRLLLPGED